MSRIDRINARIAARKAVVLTLQDLCDQARAGRPLQEVDLVSMAFTADISGSAVVLVVPVAGRGVFTRAEEMFLNGVRGHAGPAPNERLGVVDTMLFADEKRPDDEGYDGAALFLDLLAGKSIEVECHSVEHTLHHNVFTLPQAEFARFYVYNAPLPPGAEDLEAVREMLIPGTRLALNGSQGIVVGTGTRSRPGAMTISVTADMHDMQAELFTDSSGRPRHTVAIAMAPSNAKALAQLVEWALSRQHDSFANAVAQAGARQLKQLIEEGSFELAETGAMSTM